VPDFAFTIRNNFDELPAAAGAATQFLESNNASTEVIFAANLAIEEIVTNTIKYGYNDALQHEIAIRLSLTKRVLWIEICDDGNEFDPFSQPEPNICLPANERQIGGLGIHFLRNMLDTCTYVRREEQNIVSLSKKL
jgi:serine/threonine-protein kinase RsbW